MSTIGLAAALFPATRRLVLRELVRAGDAPVHLREIARRTGLDPTGVKRELKNLETAGIVLSSRSGNQVLFTLNQGCPIYADIRSMMEKTEGVAHVIREMLAPFADRIELAFIYGSIAAGGARPDSDVDVFIVGDIGFLEFSAAVSKTEEKLNREINISTATRGEYDLGLRKGEGFVCRVSRGPKLVLTGDENEP